MRSLAVIAAALALLVLPAGAAAQDPFGPIAPSDPPPAPPPQPAPQEAPAQDDGDLGAIESVGLAAIALLVIGAVFVAIAREGRRVDRRARHGRRGKRTGPASRPGTGGERQSRAQRNAPPPPPRKAPPPPPRKRRAKAKRR